MKEVCDMDMEDHGHENRAAAEYMDRERMFAEERKRMFVNMRETVIDVVCTLEREGCEFLPDRMKSRIMAARTEEEVRMVMDGLLVLAGLSQ